MNTFIVQQATFHTTRGLETVAVNPPGEVADFTQVCTAQWYNRHTSVMSAHDLCHVIRLSNGSAFVTHGTHVLVFADLVLIVQLLGSQAVHPSVSQCGSKLVKQTAGCEIPVVFAVGA